MKSLFVLSDPQGLPPSAISTMTQPRDHISDFLLHPLFLITSGAIQDRDPLTVELSSF